MGPYPSSYEIEDIWKCAESPDTMKEFDARLARNVHVKVMGSDHPFSRDYKGADVWRQEGRAKMASILDLSQGLSVEVKVIGGGDVPWAAVEEKTVGKAKSGMSWSHESVSIVRFNTEGKIVSVRMYMDSKYVASHVEEFYKMNGGS